jgi:hypothetical protein
MGFVKVKSGFALLIHTPGEGLPRVTFKSRFVWPLQKSELMDVTVKPLELAVPAQARDGKAVLVCETFYLQPSLVEDDILRVAREVGCDRAGDPDVLAQLFGGRFREAIQTAVNSYAYPELTAKRNELRDTVIGVIGSELHGYHLEDLAIHDVTPRDFQQVALGEERFTLDWIEVKQAGRLDKLSAEHGFSVLARRVADGTVQHAPSGDTRLSPGEALAVAVASDRYEALKQALSS